MPASARLAPSPGIPAQVFLSKQPVHSLSVTREAAQGLTSFPDAFMTANKSSHVIGPDRRRKNPGESDPGGRAMSVAYATKVRTAARSTLATAASGHLGPQTVGLPGLDQLGRVVDLLSACGGRLPAVLEPEVLDSHRPLDVGSGQTEAGKKWWPDTTYLVDSSEFRVEFRTNATGYRARPAPDPAPHPYRIAFVGDSFTEGMQVAYESTFCARLERCSNQNVRRAGGLRKRWRLGNRPARLLAPDSSRRAGRRSSRCARPVHLSRKRFSLCVSRTMRSTAGPSASRLLREAEMGPALDRLGQPPLQVRLLLAARLSQHRQPPEPPAQPGPEELVDRPGGRGPARRRAGGAPVSVAVRVRSTRNAARRGRSSASWSSGRSPITRRRTARARWRASWRAGASTFR